MSKKYGKAILNAAKKLNLSEDLSGIDLDAFDPMFKRVSLALKERKIGKKEFKLLLEFGKSINADHPLVISKRVENIPGTSKKPRTLILGMVFMNLTADIFADTSSVDDLNTNEFCPNILYYALNPLTCMRIAKPLPISLSSTHTSERFLERAKSPLNYANDDFMESISLGLSIINVLGEELNKKAVTMSPIILPHEKGFFLGHMEECSEYLFTPLIEGSSKTNGYYEQGSRIDTDNTLKDWRPNYRMYLKTFISNDNFFAPQKALKSRFNKLLSNENHQDAVLKIHEGYFKMDESYDRNDSDIKSFKKELITLFNSSDWHKCAQASMRHLPEKTYEETVLSQIMSTLQNTQAI